MEVSISRIVAASRRKQNARAYEMGFDLRNAPASAEPTPRLGELPGSVR